MNYKSKEKCLINRINQNYLDFHDSLKGVSRKKLIEASGRITAVTEAFEMLTEYHSWTEGEMDFCLLFCDPLTVISDAWENRCNKETDDFDSVFLDLALSDDILTQYPLIDCVQAKLKMMSLLI